MPIEITMPRLSDTMEEGTLIKWRVGVGDRVASGDLLADVETDKATMELQSYDDGTVAELSVGEGETLPVGARILVLAEEGESAEEAVSKLGKGAEGSSGAVGSDGEGSAAAAEGGGGGGTATAAPPSAGRVRISPLARKLAEEHHVDPATIRGTGPDGRIIKRDVLAAAGLAGAPGVASAPAAERPPASGPAGGAVAPMLDMSRASGALESKLVPVSNMRKTIARRLVESKSTIPHFTVTVEVVMDKLLDLRATLNKHLAEQPDPVKLSVNDFIISAAALCLVKHPHVNASWADGGIQLHGSANVGVAVAIPLEKGGGLVVPTIRDAQNLSLRMISTEVRRLAVKARTHGLSVEDMSDGTFTISNLGMLGVDHFEAIINPPQAAILAVGAALPKPVVEGGKVVVASVMTATLSADHRVIDGASAAEFLQTLKDLLENPALLLV